MRQDSKFSVLENTVQIKCHVQKIDALNKHIQRSVYQAAICKNALNAVNNIINYGWLVDENGNLSINWMDLPPVPQK